MPTPIEELTALEKATGAAAIGATTPTPIQETTALELGVTGTVAAAEPAPAAAPVPEPVQETIIQTAEAKIEEVIVEAEKVVEELGAIAKAGYKKVISKV